MDGPAAGPSSRLAAAAQDPRPAGSHTHTGRTRAPVTGRNQASGTPDSSICGQRR